MDSNDIVTDICDLKRGDVLNYNELQESIKNYSISLNIDEDRVRDFINNLYIRGKRRTKLFIENRLITKMSNKFIQSVNKILENEKYYETSRATIRDYKKTRLIDSDCICFSPYISMDFRRSGNVKTCCWSNLIVGNYPENTVKEIWNSALINELRNNVDEKYFPILKYDCQFCINNLLKRNFDLVGTKTYDQYLCDFRLRNFKNSYPLIFNFEMSNICNCECITCGGNWSSKILKNREGLPEQINPYDQNFREQLKEFYPTLLIANFLGGEPLLNMFNYDIIEDIQKINPNIRISITTNGTVLNDRIKNILEYNNNNINLVVSMDGFTKQTYESIRRGSDFDIFMSNIKYFIECRNISLAITPIIQNWKEIPMILQFCQDNNISCNFNLTDEPLGGRIIGIHENGTIERGSNRCKNLIPEICLNRLSKSDIEKIIEYYSAFSYTLQIQNRFNSLIGALRSYIV